MSNFRSVFGRIYDVGKALSHCEMCLDGMKSEDISDHPYEFFYNSFVYYIDQAWKISDKYFADFEEEYESVSETRQVVDNDRTGDDELIYYMHHARNQITHEGSILHFSEEENPANLGEPIQVEPHNYTRDTDRYSTIVMPSFRMSFNYIYVYAKPVSFHGGEITVDVPNSHQGSNIDNNPNNMADLTYEYYGSRIQKMHDKVRSK